MENSISKYKDNIERNLKIYKQNFAIPKDVKYKIEFCNSRKDLYEKRLKFETISFLKKHLIINKIRYMNADGAFTLSLNDKCFTIFLNLENDVADIYLHNFFHELTHIINLYIYLELNDMNNKEKSIITVYSDSTMKFCDEFLARMTSTASYLMYLKNVSEIQIDNSFIDEPLACLKHEYEKEKNLYNLAQLMGFAVASNIFFDLKADISAVLESVFYSNLYDALLKCCDVTMLLCNYLLFKDLLNKISLPY